ncbi:hypothetical protein HYH03_009731 [Edaphochlamys debaryana]|uniref:Cytochrome P450 n=1 Tax=Edaphochlamys debaryana TaxID=47281 RepID=A0A835XXH3_9CHLO|nr:hypothetical protein HYH03_009731 [Edaphochlamys debaryana]|eukprot:KAG2492001.1 hypothetical protein HYH03_009731 [Edaphochlamys debaryana]
MMAGSLGVSALAGPLAAPASLAAALLAAVAALLLLAALALVVKDAAAWWRLRRIPGPPSLPLLGCIPQILRRGGPFFFRDCAGRYGPVFKVALGRTWTVVVADAELARQAGQKLRNHVIIEPNLMRTWILDMDQYGLFQAKDAHWRLVRSSWQPAFSSASLSGYLPRMMDCAEALAGRLAGRAAGAGRVDLWRELGAMTLQVVGSTAYGVDFQTTGEEPQPQPQPLGQEEGQGRGVGKGAQQQGPHFGKRLAQAAGDIFRVGSAFHGSRYQRVAMLFPELRRPLSALAHALPDRPFARLVESRMYLFHACMDLITAWKGRTGDPKEGSSNGSDDVRGANGHHQGNGHVNGAAGGGAAALAPIGPVEDSGQVEGRAVPKGAAKGDVPGVDPPAPSVSPGSFLGLMLAARDKATGQGLTDLQVAAQVSTFILAGYETTANALTFAVYCLATNPEAEARLIAEVDSVLGPDRLPTEADLSRLVYTEAVINEAMRLFPPAHATTRIVGEEPVEIGGVTLPPATPVILAIMTAHTDPRVWPRVDDFVPERFMPTSPLYPEVCAKVPGAHAPFGYGSRMCIGWKFALMEAKAVLAILYQRLRFEMEPGQGPLPLATALTLAPRDGLWVRPVLRSH